MRLWADWVVWVTGWVSGRLVLWLRVALPTLWVFRDFLGFVRECARGKWHRKAGLSFVCDGMYCFRASRFHFMIVVILNDG